ncbi:hypothetical protein DICSQDRAFT_156326 [Dichomitus squalens LYAD-421 SS1]|uniref:Uncharacterized protein n=2 Tax=Dichomitus squalens TaxID=114155 RepID=A0A4Q9MRH2_9APHY|nr:uncharacterized protein DICSQDRAFT_156326 [Dichomitus squalens LYAD-421 SS1]EJF59344.1 hypothetical protein DICSQDRAFT_156326 [Dichomitus squalens LYAD-421 SS1]TBU30165.1 hypothetical protein BD311DRAFT_242599 [Dichomitus squalens]TBU61396.1 hypothetical protein BD310DRAFT_193813 [Dichomitus squalens]
MWMIITSQSGSTNSNDAVLSVVHAIIQEFHSHRGPVHIEAWREVGEEEVLISPRVSMETLVPTGELDRSCCETRGQMRYSITLTYSYACMRNT